MLTVNKVSKISGITVRTLHYYDSIGLLKPTEVTETGYRLYGDEALQKLQSILMYRELGFSLADIKEIMNSPGFDLGQALEQHIKMLEMQRKHIDGLIEAAKKLQKGENAGFEAFDTETMKQYAEEVKKKWGNTEAYRESQEKAAGKTPAEQSSMADGLMDKFREMGKIRDVAPDSKEAQDAVKELQDYITENYYTCTNEILACLGQMYTADERFRENIDKAGGTGTAEFAGRAIEIYCSRR